MFTFFLILINLKKMDELLRKVELLEAQIFDFLLNMYISDLKKNGYVIIPNVISDEEIQIAKDLFYKWKNSIPNHDKIRYEIKLHGIYG